MHNEATFTLGLVFFFSFIAVLILLIERHDVLVPTDCFRVGTLMFYTAIALLEGVSIDMTGNEADVRRHISVNSWPSWMRTLVPPRHDACQTPVYDERTTAVAATGVLPFPAEANHGLVDVHVDLLEGLVALRSLHIPNISRQQFCTLGPSIRRRSHADGGTKLAMVGVLHVIIAQGSGLEVRKCRRINLGLEFHQTYVMFGSGSGLVIGVADEALGLEDLVVPSLVLAWTFRRPRSIGTDVPTVEFFEEVVLVVVRDALKIDVCVEVVLER
jgi:hypothetical protein